MSKNNVIFKSGNFNLKILFHSSNSTTVADFFMAEEILQEISSSRAETYSLVY